MTCSAPEGSAMLYENCAARLVLDRVGDKWTALVIGLLETGPVRFNRLRAALPGISQKVLTSTLRSLERDGLVARQVTLAVPVRVEYSLTELGTTLVVPLQALRAWALAHFDDVGSAREEYDARPVDAVG